MYNEESSRALSHPPLGLEDIRAIKYNIYIYIYIYIMYREREREKITYVIQYDLKHTTYMSIQHTSILWRV